MSKTTSALQLRDELQAMGEDDLTTQPEGR